MSRKFSTLFPDADLQRMQREIEDNLVDVNDIEGMAKKTEKFVTEEPVLNRMTDGEEIAYNDGTNKWIYRRIGAGLYKWQLTGV